MSCFKFHLKSFVEKYCTSFLGRYLSCVPYEIKLGRSYSASLKQIRLYGQMSRYRLKDDLFRRIKAVVESAYDGNPFYHAYYDSVGFSPSHLRGFEDISLIPPVEKSTLKAYQLEERSTHSRGRLLLNTGGTSGQPFDFYVDREAFARHFAHYHFTWKRLGYHPSQVKLTFRGKNISSKPLHYNAVHNEYYVNAYCGYGEICRELRKHLKEISYIHGYPSAIYQFVKHCAENNPALLEGLRRQVKGIFFDSEFPVPVYRDFIEEHLSTNSLACYGHSEMALMAFEIEKNIYQPHHSYGYCEVVPNDRGYALLGTSYHNPVSPFIRYDTGDLIKPISVVDGVLEAFAIEEGRIGDFIEDRNGKKVSLTAFVFGRHHKIFSYADFVQIRQQGPGRAEIIVTADQGADIAILRSSLDTSNIDVDFTFRVVASPVRTKLGKVPLLVVGNETADTGGAYAI